MSCGEKSAAVVTDLGCYDEYTVSHLQNLDVLLLEANHDVTMVEKGPYPMSLKRRIPDLALATVKKEVKDPYLEIALAKRSGLSDCVEW